MKAYYVQAPDTTTMNGLNGLTMWYNNRTDLMGLHEAMKLQAMSGGEIKTIDFGNLSHEELALMSEHIEYLYAIAEAMVEDSRPEEVEEPTPEPPTDPEPEFVEEVVSLPTEIQDLEGIEHEPELPDHEESFVDILRDNTTEDEFQAAVETVEKVPDLSDTGLSPHFVLSVANKYQLIIPTYNEMAADVARARKENPDFDFGAVTGGKQDKQTMTRAWVYLQLQPLMNQ